MESQKLAKVYDKTEYQTQLRQHRHFCVIKTEHLQPKKKWYLKISKEYVADAILTKIFTILRTENAKYAN